MDVSWWSCSLAWQSRIEVDTSFGFLVVPFILLELGMGFTMSPMRLLLPSGELLVVYDKPADARLRSDDAVMADVFEFESADDGPPHPRQP